MSKVTSQRGQSWQAARTLKTPRLIRQGEPSGPQGSKLARLGAQGASTQVAAFPFPSSPLTVGNSTPGPLLLPESPLVAGRVQEDLGEEGVHKDHR